MRAYTIVVDDFRGQPSGQEAVPFPGVLVDGPSLEGCLEKSRDAISIYMEDLPVGDAPRWERPEPATDQPEPTAGGAADEEALDAVHRAGAALATIEADVLHHLAQREDARLRGGLRRAHMALVRARSALIEAESALTPGGPAGHSHSGEQTTP